MYRMHKYFLAVTAILGTIGFAPSDALADEYCREYTRTINIGGKMQEGYGTACLMPDGTWRIRNEEVRYIETTPNYVPVHNRPTQMVYYRERRVPVMFYDHAPRYKIPPGHVKNWAKGHNNHYGVRGHDRHRHHGPSRGHR